MGECDGVMTVRGRVAPDGSYHNNIESSALRTVNALSISIFWELLHPGCCTQGITSAHHSLDISSINMTRRGREEKRHTVHKVRTSVLRLRLYTQLNALSGNMIIFVMSSLCQFSGWGMLPVNNITKTNRNIIWHQTLTLLLSTAEQGNDMTPSKLIEYLLTQLFLFWYFFDTFCSCLNSSVLYAVLCQMHKAVALHCITCSIACYVVLSF